MMPNLVRCSLAVLFAGGVAAAQATTWCAGDITFVRGWDNRPHALPLGGTTGPEDVAWHPGTGTLFVSQVRTTSTGMILLNYSLDGTLLAGNVTSIAGLSGLCRHPTNGNLLGSGGDTIREYTTSAVVVGGGFTMTVSGAGGFQDMDVHPATGLLYALTGSGRCYRINVATGTQTLLFTNPAYRCQGMCFTPQGTILLATAFFNPSFPSGTILEIDTAGTLLNTGFPSSNHLRVNPDPCVGGPPSFGTVNGLTWVGSRNWLAMDNFSPVSGATVALHAPRDTEFITRVGTDTLKANGLPFALAANGSATLGGPGFTLTLTNATPFTDVYLGLSLARDCANPAFGNGTLYIDTGPGFLGLVPIPALTSTVVLPVPLTGSGTSLDGADIYAQFAGLDLGAIPPAFVTSSCSRVHLESALPGQGGGAAVTGLSATPYPTSVHLQWNAAAGATGGYDVHRRQGSSGSFQFVNRVLGVTLGGQPKTSFDDDHLTAGTTYEYEVRPVAAGGAAGCASRVTVTTTAPSAAYRIVARLDVLVPVYTGGASPIGSADAAELRSGVENSRMFVYRNSDLRLVLDVSWLEIAAAPPNTTGPFGSPTMADVEADLRARGVLDDQYDLVLACGNGMVGCYGGFPILGSTGGSFVDPVGCGGSTLDWPVGATAWVKRGWGFLHEMQHALDLILAQQSGHPEMIHGDVHSAVALWCGSADTNLDAGQQYDWQRNIFRRYAAYSSFASPWNGYLETSDADFDRVASADGRFPTDEARLGSNSVLPDTDGDGRSDDQEVSAGMFRGSDPLSGDTDGDGTSDGSDPLPLHDHATAITAPPGGAVTIDGTISAGEWTRFAGGVDSSEAAGFGATVYANRSGGRLHFAFETTSPCAVLLYIDGSASTGWFQGNDSFLVSVTQTDVRSHGSTPPACLTVGLGGGNYGTMPGGAGTPISGSSVASGSGGGLSVIEASFPTALGQGWGLTGEATTGFSATPGSSIGLRVVFTTIGNATGNVFSGSQAFLGEPYALYDLSL